MNACLSEAFKEGFVSTITLSRATYNTHNEKRYDDYEALRGDWLNVGKAIKKATEGYANNCAIRR